MPAFQEYKWGDYFCTDLFADPVRFFFVLSLPVGRVYLFMCWIIKTDKLSVNKSNFVGFEYLLALLICVRVGGVNGEIYIYNFSYRNNSHFTNN